MKKFLTLVALFAMTLGANAVEWVEDYKIDYSQNTGFPFYVMGYVPEWIDGVMTDFGANYKYVAVEGAQETSDVIVKTQGNVEYYKIELAEPAWHQYFIADGIPTELDGAYTVKAMVKASEACTINVNMGWGWNEGQSIGASVSIGTEWEEVEWDYTGVGGTSCNLVAQPGSSTATIEWKYVTVGHSKKEERPVEWLEQIVNGNAEQAWPAWALEEKDGINANWRGDRTGEICAWNLTMGRNFDDQNTVISEDSPRSRPFPADIEAEPGNESNHVFAVHMTRIDKIDDDNSIQWSNQFWIQSPQAWKSGTQIKVHFRYKAEKAAKTATQIHKQHPSDYLHWEAIGDINFSTEWQEFDKTITFNESQGGGWSIAFNLCAESTVDSPQEPNVFYFDDLSWQIMKLDEGYFVASQNAETGLEYDYANATEFVWDADEKAFVATVGTKGDEESWVNEVMISTVRGNDAAFKGATLKPTGSVEEDEWLDYTEGSLAKIKLPAAGVWKIYVAPDDRIMKFEKIEGEANKEPIEINPNPTVVIVNGQEREYTEAEAEEAGVDKPENPGQAWDNQFFIVANRVLDAGEVTVLEFDYESTVDAKTTTQCHAMPGGYIHWGCIGDVNFTTESQHFEYTFTVPNECAGKDMKTIAFNMAEIKGACVYKISNVVWKLEDETESLIDQEGTKNFFVKEGAGTDPYEFGTDPNGINNVMKSNNASTVTFNLAGQRVNKDYKGIVIKNGSKYIAK
ncbi:MAG: hypothetical protein IKO85_05645 [Bacteroidaceae bacterium]|nr:hypothetical protein [Bacteroidaceae bacterium]